MTTEHDTENILARAIEALPERTYLVYVGQGDHLTDEQVTSLLEGEDESGKEWDHFQEWAAEAADHSVEQYLSDAIEDDDERVCVHRRMPRA
jgi:hypothetical protein